MKIFVSLFLTNIIIEVVKYLKFSNYLKSTGYKFSDETKKSSDIKEALFVLSLNLIPIAGTVLAIFIFSTPQDEFIKTAMNNGIVRKK
jgi:hypothetical protein